MKHDSVQTYYGQTLGSSEDLKTDACCTVGSVPDYLKPIMAQIHPDVSGRYYGCGLIAPEVLEGMRILDLGCGSGQDVFVLSALVGPDGFVDGVDMTPEQLDVARAHIGTHAERFGFAAPNTAVHAGFIEKLGEIGLTDESYDIIVSNCVVNLATDKLAVLQGAWDLLKPGGEMYFSDVYADTRIPEALREDEVLYGECLSGALEIGDFMDLAGQAGFTDARLVTHRPLAVQNPELQAKLGDIRFVSATYRLFKLSGLDQGCEDFGQTARYLGSAPRTPDAFVQDIDHVFTTGEETAVCGNTARILSETRFASHFVVTGERSVHKGAFPGCATKRPDFGGGECSSGGGCCG